MPAPRKYDDETRERAVRMYQDRSALVGGRASRLLARGLTSSPMPLSSAPGYQSGEPVAR
jgi:hypothetical protein